MFTCFLCNKWKKTMSFLHSIFLYRVNYYENLEYYYNKSFLNVVSNTMKVKKIYAFLQ